LETNSEAPLEEADNKGRRDKGRGKEEGDRPEKIAKTQRSRQMRTRRLNKPNGVQIYMKLEETGQMAKE